MPTPAPTAGDAAPRTGSRTRPHPESLPAPGIRRLPPRAGAARPLTALCVVAGIALASACAGTAPPPVGEDGVVRPTTAVAGAPVLGLQRDGLHHEGPSGELLEHAPDTVCGPPSPRDADADASLDAPRIAVVGDAALDTLCALGLQDRVVAAAPPAGGAPLRYLGAWASRLERAGTARDPDVEALKAADPDLILVDGPPEDPSHSPGGNTGTSTDTGTGTGADPDTGTGTAENAGERTGAGAGLHGVGTPRGLGSVGARTVTVPVAGGWQGTVTTVATAVGRNDAAEALLHAFSARADTLGSRIGADQTQASLAMFTAHDTYVLGTAGFAAQVLDEVGVQRPPGQRFASPAERQVDEGDLSSLEGDVMYAMFSDKDSGDADAGGDTPSVEHGLTVMQSSAWEGLGVTRGSVFVVDDGVWMRGRGVIAAGDITDDLAESLG